ncbi:MAG TPA: SRPBCC family protein [Chloroflexota bacterium]|nr:SRPBCC family protein [Chloroflexota bacterium]
MTTKTQAPVTTQVHRVYIKAKPEAIWNAITTSEWTRRYGYGGSVEYDLRRGGAYRAMTSDEMRAHGAPEVAIDGEVIESDPPRKLVLTWRMVMDPAMEAEGFTRLTYEIEATADGATKLTIVHDLAGAPRLASLLAGDFENEGAGGGWSWVLSDLKTLLETGTRLAG